MCTQKDKKIFNKKFKFVYIQYRKRIDALCKNVHPNFVYIYIDN